jgi:hypothetical protein
VQAHATAGRDDEGVRQQVVVRALVARLIDTLEEAEHKLVRVGCDPAGAYPHVSDALVIADVLAEELQEL